MTHSPIGTDYVDIDFAIKLTVANQNQSDADFVIRKKKKAAAE